MAERKAKPKLAERRTALAKRLLAQGPRVTGTIGPVRLVMPFARAGGAVAPTGAINRLGTAIKESPLADIPLGGVGQFMENVGTPFFRPRDAGAAVYDIAARRFLGLVPNLLEVDRP